MNLNGEWTWIFQTAAEQPSLDLHQSSQLVLTHTFRKKLEGHLSKYVTFCDVF